MNAWENLSGGPGAGHIEGSKVEQPSPESLFNADVLYLCEYGFQGVPTHNAGFDQNALVCDRKLGASPREIALEQDAKRNDEDEQRQVWIESLVDRTYREGDRDHEEKHGRKEHLPVQVSTKKNLLS